MNKIGSRPLSLEKTPVNRRQHWPVNFWHWASLTHQAHFSLIHRVVSDVLTAPWPCTVQEPQSRRAPQIPGHIRSELTQFCDRQKNEVRQISVISFNVSCIRSWVNSALLNFFLYFCQCYLDALNTVVTIYSYKQMFSWYMWYRVLTEREIKVLVSKIVVFISPQSFILPICLQ